MPGSPARAGSAEWSHGFLRANGLRFHVAQAGDGPAVLLLHGFPDFWFTWRYQMPTLAAEGFRAIAPDLRGYNTSDKPRGVSAYDVDALAEDVQAIAEQVAGGPVHLVGHDWGGIAAWFAAMNYPGRFRSLVILNAPHPAAFARDFFTTRQWLRSWYAFLFQLPWLPEAAIRARNFRALEEAYRREVFNPAAFGHGELEDYKAAFSEPGALTAAIHYYRAAFRRPRSARHSNERVIEVPTLLLWGDLDPHLGTSLTTGLEPWVRTLRIEHFPRAGHWVHLDEPDAVGAAMAEWFRRHADGPEA